MTPLRQRMIDDMRLAGFAERTRDVYIQAVRRIAAHYMRSPDVLSEEEVRAYLLHLRDERGVARGTFKTNHGGIQFLYRRTLERNWALFGGKKDPSTEAAAAADCPVGSPSPCPSGCPQESDPPDVLRAHVWLWSAHRRGRKPRR